MYHRVREEELAKALHEAGREAVEQGATVAAAKFGGSVSLSSKGLLPTIKELIQGYVSSR